jgi:GTP 3',8-cyclase
VLRAALAAEDAAAGAAPRATTASSHAAAGGALEPDAPADALLDRFARRHS